MPSLAAGGHQITRGRSEVSEFCAVNVNAAPKGTPRPRVAGRHRADFHFRTPPGTSGHASPKEGSPSKPGVLAQEEPTIPTRGRAGLWPPAGSRACPLRMVIATTGTARGRGLRGPIETALRSTTGRKIFGPSICTVCRNSRFIGFYGVQRPGRGASLLTPPRHSDGPRRRPTQWGPHALHTIVAFIAVLSGLANTPPTVGSQAGESGVEGQGARGLGWGRIGDVRAVRLSCGQDGRAARPRRLAPGLDPR